ncbi:MAG: GNAT family N-acetyltransferase [Oscillospiraceae bacterium]|nr:GNAT family N-acetyltransferase [Oscillospiraceae bacterium]
MNVYETCPTCETGRFLLRQVQEGDCADLLRVYSDSAALPLFNGDNCHGDDFHYTTPERMGEAIRFWLWSYAAGYFVRWSVVDRATDCAVGTVELFRREDDGLLRLDLRSDYEGEAEAILCLLLDHAFDWFGVERILTKAPPVAQARRRALERLGFRPAEPLVGQDGAEYDHYYRGTHGDFLCRLALLHIYGDGVAEDNALAASLLTRAAALGHAEATYNLGICYHYGYGVAADLQRAFALYLRAAEAGYGKGQELVGRFYNRGLHGTRDRAQALHWLRLAMESDDPEAVAEARKEIKSDCQKTHWPQVSEGRKV